MSHLIIISGPQSSGKTTLFNYLKKRLKRFQFISEISPYAVKKSTHPKYISATDDFQEVLTKKTLKKLNSLKASVNYVFETGPMQITYVEKYSGQKSANFYFKKYMQVLKAMSPTIIFIDIPPSISFQRRKTTYLERIKKYKLEDKKIQILNEYRQKIADLYPLWFKWLNKYPFKKIVFKNSYKTKSKFLKEIEKVIQEVLRSQPL